jgi:hypothetical protein
MQQSNNFLTLLRPLLGFKELSYEGISDLDKQSLIRFIINSETEPLDVSSSEVLQTLNNINIKANKDLPYLLSQKGQIKRLSTVWGTNWELDDLADRKITLSWTAFQNQQCLYLNHGYLLEEHLVPLQNLIKEIIEVSLFLFSTHKPSLNTILFQKRTNESK